MAFPSPEALRLGELFVLGFDHDPRRGAAGEQRARGIGSSLEFRDRRAYAPGDDMRHLDWRAYARTDQLLVRQYHEELMPRVEILLDDSRSMAVDAAKAQLTVDVACVLARAAAGGGFQVSILALSDRPEPIEFETFAERGLEFRSTRELLEPLRLSHGLLRPGGLRILLSDFLFPHRPAELVSTLARGAGGVALVQLLGTLDREPPENTALRMTDAESAEELDLILEPGLRGRYLERLKRLLDGLQDECVRRAALHIDLDAGLDLEEICRTRLMGGGLLVPA